MALQDGSVRAHRGMDCPCMPENWKKGDSIGSGSFGTVFLGLNCETGAHSSYGAIYIV